MREIKFRAWEKSNEDLGIDAEEVIKREMIYFYLGDLYWLGEETGDYSFPFDHHVMQYIGLKDKNGKEIYEGDIIKNECNEVVEIKHSIHKTDICIGHGEYGTTVSCGFNIATHGKEFEVIGNIHENPELL